MRAAISLSFAAALAGLGAACGPEVSRAPGSIAPVDAPSLTWPAPPQPPRIRLVNVVTSPEDLGIQPSLWRRVAEFFVGKQEGFFVRPTSVAVRGGAVYVADPGAQTLWILDPSQRRVRRVRKADGQALVSPVAVALGGTSRIYLADSYRGQVFVFDQDGQWVQTLAVEGMRRPAGLAYDGATDRLYVADSAAHRIWVFTGDGRLQRSIGKRGISPGDFNFPTHVAVGGDHKLYVTDALGFRIQIFDRAGDLVGVFGRHGNGSGDFAAPKGVGSDSVGHIYVVDALFDTIQVFDQRGQLLLNFGDHGSGQGQFWLPGGLFIDARDRIYVTDAYNRRIQIFQYLGGVGS